MKFEAIGDEHSVRAVGGDAAVQVMMRARQDHRHNCHVASPCFFFDNNTRTIPTDVFNFSRWLYAVMSQLSQAMTGELPCP